MIHGVDTAEYIAVMRELGKYDIDKFISEINSSAIYSLNRVFHHIMRYHEANDSLDSALRIVKPLVEFYSKSHRKLAGNLSTLLCSVLLYLVVESSWNDYCDYLGDYCNDKVIDEIYRCVYDALHTEYSHEDTITYMKKSAVRLVERYAIPGVSSKLARKIKYNVPYASFKDKHELHQYFMLRNKEIGDLINSCHNTVVKLYGSYKE